MRGQIIFDLGEPRQHDITFPLSLAEKYRPQRLTQFAGLTEAKKVFAALLKAPRPCNLMLVGPPGAGKTTMALAFAELLPGTLNHISSQKADVAAIDGLWEHCQFCPVRGRFHVIVLDEADEATERAQVQLLSRLDSAATLKPSFGGGVTQGAPPPIIWIFTSNGTGPEHTDPAYRFERRFLSRCVVVPFPRPSDEELVVAYLAAVHHAEGRNSLSGEDFLRIASVSDGMRDALMKLESCHLRDATEFVLPPPPVVPVARASSAVPIPADREEAALALYGKPYEELKPAFRAWVTMRTRGSRGTRAAS
jgi:energy-coupling factor transporter ATP-binding protein EcfA2